MRLHITVVNAPGLIPPKDSERPAQLPANLVTWPVELVVEAQAGAAGGDLAQQLGLLLQQLRLRVQQNARFWIDGRPLETLSVGRVPLVNGAVIVTAPTLWTSLRGHPDDAALYLNVLSGPDAGLLVALKRGIYTVGRSGCDITIMDPSLSRLHADLVVTSTRLTLRDRSSTNGVTVDGVPRTTTSITTASVFSLGGTSCAVRLSDSYHPDAQPVDIGGRPVDIGGQPTDVGGRPVDISGPLLVPSAPAITPPGRMFVLAAVPLIVGIGLAVFTGTWMFLAFSVMSAMTLMMPLVGGFRRRKIWRSALHAGVEADRLRRHQAAPAVGDIAATAFYQARAAFTDSVSEQPPAGDSHPTYRTEEVGPVCHWLRLGTADQAANVRMDPPDPDFVPPMLAGAPVIVDLGRTSELRVVGSAARVAAMLRSVILQLTTPSAGADRRIVLVGAVLQLPLSARFLPAVVLTASQAAARRAALETTGPGTVFIIYDADLIDSATRDQLANLQAKKRIAVLWCDPGQDASPPAVLTITAATASLHQGASKLTFQPDLISTHTFDRYARWRARAVAGEPKPVYDGTSRRAALPRRCALDDIAVATTSRGIVNEWHQNSRAERLAAVLGVSAAGPVSLDLQQDGPHLLIAGTTGSGKSELLRSLVLSLAQRYDPSSVSLLFLDFKGGSGLGPLQSLPHCVGMLTDLSSEAVSRALVSLQAEVKRRETLFAAVQADNLDAYRRLTAAGEEEAVPHLILIIDEFRILKEEVPEAMDGLLHIATVGRSLGVHLVLATQRPQGAVSADIRANVTSTIALRVRTGFESQDLIDTPDAANLSADLPGRAYLKRAGEAPLEFQAASSARLAQGSAAADRCRVRLLDQILVRDEQMAEESADGDAALSGEAALGAYLAEIQLAVELAGGFTVHRPIAPALPSNFGEAEYPAVPQSTDPQTLGISLGPADFPARQRLEELRWDPVVHSHLALIGQPGSGSEDAARRVLTQWLWHEPELSNFYMLDADGTLAAARDQVQVGAYAAVEDLRHAARVLERMAELVSERLAAAGSGAERDNGAEPVLGLIITGWGRWVSAFRNSSWAWAEETLLDLLRDGASARLTVVMSGDREIVTSRFFALIPNRIYLPTGASPESLLTWPRLPAMKSIPGRGCVYGPMVTEPSVVQLPPCGVIKLPEPTPLPSGGDPPWSPVRIRPLPRSVTVTSLRNTTPADGMFVVGVAGDDPTPAAIALPSAAVLLILGAPRTGKTNALAALAELNTVSRSWISSPRSGATTFLQDLRDSAAGMSAEEIAATTLLIDDVDRLPLSVYADLTVLQAAGFAVVMTAASGPAVSTRIPLAAQARGGGKGILLMPRSFLDGDFFGIRTEIETQFIPGRAVLIDAGRTVHVQLARHE